MVARVRALGPAMLERATVYDREARFPTENFADFHRVGLLKVCVPTRYGGLGSRVTTVEKHLSVVTRKLGLPAGEDAARSAVNVRVLAALAWLDAARAG